MHSGTPEKMLDDYVVVRTLGEGGYGKVVLGRHRKTGALAALKVLDYARMPAEERVANFKTYQIEYQILKDLDHPRIVRFFSLVEKGAYRSANKTRTVAYAAMEFCPRGELFELLASGGGLSENASRHYFLQLLDAVSHLHGRGLAHRDLKPENILFDASMGLKLVDFGFATLSPEGAINNTELGSEGYRAPEFYRKPVRYVASQVDAFATGVVLFVMFTGLPPFRKPTSGCQLFERLRTGDKGYWDYYEKAIKKPIPLGLRTLISGLLSADPEKRMSLAEAGGSEWARGETSGEEAVKEVEARMAKNAEPVEVAGAEGPGEDFSAPNRSGGTEGRGGARFRVDRDPETQGSGVRFLSSDVHAALELLREQLASEEAVAVELGPKGRLILRRGPTAAKLVVSQAEAGKEFTARLVPKEGNYQDLLQLKQDLATALKKIA